MRRYEIQLRGHYFFFSDACHEAKGKRVWSHTLMTSLIALTHLHT